MAPPGSCLGVCSMSWRSISRCSDRNRTSWWPTLGARAILVLPLGVSVSKIGRVSCRVSGEFTCGTRKHSFHHWSSTYHLTVPQLDTHCQGVEYHNGTAWVVFGSMLDELALDFALQRSQSDELVAHPGRSSDSRLAPWGQRLKDRTRVV